VLLAIEQADFMAATVGTDVETYRTGVGFFCPQSPLASDAGMQALTSKRDAARAKQLIEGAGYKGEKVVLLGATDFPVLKALADVGADTLHRCGLNVDYQAMDWGTVVQRRAKKEPPDKGGWNVFSTSWPGLDHFNPATNVVLRCNGAQAWTGWPNSPRLEALHGQWLDTADAPEQKRICVEIQKQAFEDVPYIPLGQFFTPMAYRTNLIGILNGFPFFWNVRRAA
jgi:peptide/nickel transport system substrate-binding protein